MENYKTSVDTMFRLGSDASIPNTDAKHAIILLGSIFNYAKDQVNVFCDNAKKEIFDDEFLANAIRNAVTRGVTVRFILQRQRLDSSTVADILEKYPRDLISIKHYSGEINNLRHFTESDEKAFRVEIDHDGATALGCANNSTVAKTYRKLFNILWDASDVFAPQHEMITVCGN